MILVLETVLRFLLRNLKADLLLSAITFPTPLLTRHIYTLRIP